MEIELPVIDAGQSIGKIIRQTGQVISGDPINFRCKLSGDCCTQLNIPVTDFDIKRIEDHGYALDQIIETASPLIRFSNSDDSRGERNYWIKRKPYNNTCTFLQDNKCSIHEFKPFGCQVFPFQLRAEDDDVVDVVIHGSNLCQSIAAVSATGSNNIELLENLKEIINAENRYREDYFVIYGNK